MLIACLFGKFLGLNLHFQKILPTVNKITASIKSLLPATLPATVPPSLMVVLNYIQTILIFLCLQFKLLLL